MILSGSNGAEFELKILGYQFPHIIEEIYDANWLNIFAKASWEASWLHNWLLYLSEGQIYGKQMSFLEPELGFEVSELSTPNIILEVKHRVTSKYYWKIQLNLDSTELKRSCEEFKIEIEKFPGRGEGLDKYHRQPVGGY